MSFSSDIVDSTAAGVIDLAPRFSIIMTSGALTVSGTSSFETSRLWQDHSAIFHDSTVSGTDVDVSPNAGLPERKKTTSHAIYELRRISGLTWEQVGQLFGVSRRSIHFWASGKQMNATNEMRLFQVMDILRQANREDVRSTRVALFEVTDGRCPFELLMDGQFDEARALLGTRSARPTLRRTALSDAARATRMPLPLESLLGSSDISDHRELDKGRSVQAVRSTDPNSGR